MAPPRIVLAPRYHCLLASRPDATLVSLFSAGGGKTNDDLPPTSNYRKVTDAISHLTPFVVDYAHYNDPEYNTFFRDRVAPPPPTIVV